MSSGGFCGRGLMFGLGLAQVALTAGVVMFYPLASAQVYVYTPCVANGTLTHACGSTRVHRLQLPLLLVAVSAGAAAFTSTTFGLMEAGTMREDTPFGAEALGQTGMWDALFWFVFAAAHAMAVLAACSPVDLFAGALAVHLMALFLMRVCQPSDAEHPNVSLANANILGYMAGAGVAACCVPAQYSNRLLVLFGMAVLDYFLGVGHVWDRAPTMETVGNARLFWCVAASVGLAVLYASWREEMVPSLGVDGE